MEGNTITVRVDLYSYKIGPILIIGRLPAFIPTDTSLKFALVECNLVLTLVSSAAIHTKTVVYFPQLAILCEVTNFSSRNQNKKYCQEIWPHLV